jgi:hypothetical protein
VLEPWVAGLPFEFDESSWPPRESRLTILESAALESADPEDAWSAALRAAEDVTRPMLEAAEASAPTQRALIVEAESVESALGELSTGQPAQQISWPAAIERIERHDPDLTAVILVVKRSGSNWQRPQAQRPGGDG